MPLMKYRISVTLEFLREMKHLSKRYKSLKEDLRNFGNDLLLNPEQGVSLGNNLRKIRIAITSKNKGKSGGARVITYTIIWTEIDTEIKLLTSYLNETNFRRIRQDKISPEFFFQIRCAISEFSPFDFTQIEIVITIHTTFNFNLFQVYINLIS